MDINKQLSYKGNIIHSFGFIANSLNQKISEESDCNNNPIYVILLTAFGTIKGTIKSNTEEAKEVELKKIEDTRYQVTINPNQICEDVLKLLSDDNIESAFDRTSAITLRNVTVTPANNAVNYQYDTLTVFADQIIAVSIANA